MSNRRKRQGIEIIVAARSTDHCEDGKVFGVCRPKRGKEIVSPRGRRAMGGGSVEQVMGNGFVGGE